MDKPAKGISRDNLPFELSNQLLDFSSGADSFEIPIFWNSVNPDVDKPVKKVSMRDGANEYLITEQILMHLLILTRWSFTNDQQLRVEL